MKQRFETLEQIHEALEQGLKVYWSSEAYAIHHVPNDSRLNQESVSPDGKRLIRASCISNYFGSLISKHEARLCFTFGEVGTHKFN